jgi:hypothetical protein
MAFTLAQGNGPGTLQPVVVCDACGEVMEGDDNWVLNGHYLPAGWGGEETGVTSAAVDDAELWPYTILLAGSAQCRDSLCEEEIVDGDGVRHPLVTGYVPFGDYMRALTGAEDISPTWLYRARGTPEAQASRPKVLPFRHRPRSLP